MDWNLRVRGLGDELISAWDAKRIAALPKEEKERLRCIVDAAGERSARAQGLGAVITDLSRVQSNGHLLYLAASFSSGTTKLLGLLKVGRKNLFIRVDSGALKETAPLCVLDFYVHESCQRSGLGSKLMTRMLQDKSAAPARLGYDRPSPKLLSFLKKHHGLSDYIPQSNNFVVFRQYWAEGSTAESPSSQRGSRTSSRSGREDAHGSAPRRVAAAAAAAPEAGRSGATQQQQKQQLGRRAAPPPPALPPDPLADPLPLCSPAASHTTTTVTGARPPSLAVRDHAAAAVPGPEGIIEPHQYSPPNQPRFGRRASGESRGVSPVHPPPGPTPPPSVVYQQQQHQHQRQVSPQQQVSPQAAAPGGHGYPQPPQQAYQQPPRYPPGQHYTYHAQPGHHQPYQTPPPGPRRAAGGPHQQAATAAPQQQSHHGQGHQAHQQHGAPQAATRAEAGFSPPLGAAAHHSHHQRYPGGQGHDRQPHHHGYSAPSPDHVSKYGVAPQWGHQEQDSLSAWQAAKGGSATPPPRPYPISRSNSACSSSSHHNYAMPPAAYSMPIPAPSGSPHYHHHNRHHHHHRHHGAPAARAARVSPAKAMALRQQEGNGAKGAMAW